MFNHEDYDNHESVTHFSDPETGLKAIIAVHNSNLGPAMGGTRMWNYATDEEALTDVLRLSKGMSYKSALAGIPVGGGKSVIIGDAKTQKTPELFEAFGRAVETLKGAYTAAEDVGVTVEDLEHARYCTQYIAGITEGRVGNPSPATAWGVYNGIKAAVKYKFHRDSVEGITVSILGLGNVGYALAGLLHENGAKLIVADINDTVVGRAVEEFKAGVVSPNEILDVPTNVFAPCALGGIINQYSFPTMAAKIVAGAANNQLENEHMSRVLKAHGRLYVPDYAINAGGIMIISKEGPQFDREKEMKWIGDSIYNTLTDIFERAEAADITTSKMADIIALERLNK